MKTCTKCQQVKPLISFSKDRSRKDGLCLHCKACRRKYREANIDRIKAHDVAYYQTNKDRIKKVKAAYRIKNRAARLEYAKRYYQDHKEHILATKRKYKKKMAKDLSDEYIKNQIQKSRSWFFGRDEITPELIELKRYEIIIQRILKQKKDEI